MVIVALDSCHVGGWLLNSSTKPEFVVLLFDGNHCNRGKVETPGAVALYPEQPLVGWALADSEQHPKLFLVLCLEQLLPFLNLILQLNLPNKWFEMGGGKEITGNSVNTEKCGVVLWHMEWDFLQNVYVIRQTNLILLFHDSGMQNFQLII